MKISNSIALLLFLTADFSGALAADRSRVEGSFVIAQTSMGGSEADAVHATASAVSAKYAPGAAAAADGLYSSEPGAEPARTKSA